MANKNTKFKNSRRVAARPNGERLVSANERRNMAMRVYTNTDSAGKKYSVTAHEPLDAGFVTFKNHAYMREDEHGRNNYRQPVV